MTEDEMAGQCHQSNQHEFDTTMGGSGGQEGLACSGPWRHEESDTTKRQCGVRAHLSLVPGHRPYIITEINCGILLISYIRLLKLYVNIKQMQEAERFFYLGLQV